MISSFAEASTALTGVAMFGHTLRHKDVDEPQLAPASDVIDDTRRPGQMWAGGGLAVAGTAVLTYGLVKMNNPQVAVIVLTGMLLIGSGLLVAV